MHAIEVSDDEWWSENVLSNGSGRATNGLLTILKGCLQQTKNSW